MTRNPNYSLRSPHESFSIYLFIDQPRFLVLASILCHSVLVPGGAAYILNPGLDHLATTTPCLYLLIPDRSLDLQDFMQHERLPCFSDSVSIRGRADKQGSIKNPCGQLHT